MFTGIIEKVGRIVSIEESGSNLIFWVESSISTELTIDQSLAHNGVCLTIENIKENTHQVSAIQETLRKTNLALSAVGDLVNLERCIQMNGRLDGHIVQGHVDTVAACIGRKEYSGSSEFRFKLEEHFAHLVIEKGSISINGISLTVFDVGHNEFKVAIIPYTFHHTNVNSIHEGSMVNVEFDIVGKYVQRWQQLKT